MRNLLLEEYNPRWKIEYEKEKNLLNQILGGQLIDIYHIGSTSIPNLISKPIIDILLIVENINQVEQFRKKLESIGYVWKGEFGIAGRRYLEKIRLDVNKQNQPEDFIHLHIYQKDSPEIKRHLLFQDYLLSHPKVVEEYNKLKKELFAKVGNNRQAYQEGKEEFIKMIENKIFQIQEKDD